MRSLPAWCLHFVKMASQVVGASERTLFVGHKIPEEIKQMSKVLNSGSLDKAAFRIILTATVSALEGKSVDSDVFSRLKTPDNKVTDDMLKVVYSGMHRLLQLALRFSETSLKQEVFIEDLQELKIPKEFAIDLASAVYGSRRTSLLKQAQQTRPHLPTLESLDWRVDVGISTSVLNRLLEPTVQMHVTLSDKNAHNFEMSIAKFHELRFSVASLLKEMEDLEKRTVLKIQD